MILDRLLGLIKVAVPPSAAASCCSSSSSAFPPLSLFSGVASHLSSQPQHVVLVMTGCMCSSSYQPPCQVHTWQSLLLCL